MLFQLFFLLACCDLYAHAPGTLLAKQVCGAISLAAVASDRPLGYLSCEVSWFLVVLWELVFASKTALSNLDVASDATEPEGDDGGATALPKLPKEAVAVVEETWTKFTQNLDPKKSCDGCDWEVVSDSNNIRISKASIPGLSIKRWKVQLEIFGSRQAIHDELFDYDKRLGKTGWDTALESGKVVAEFQDGYAMSVYYTASQGGGAIASRELVDVRKLEFPDTGGFKLAMTSLDEKKFKNTVKGYPSGNKKLIRAFNPPGGGCCIEPVDDSLDVDAPQLFRYTLVSNIDLKGWIFPSVINTALPTALQDSHEAMVAHLKQKCGPQLVHAHSD